MLSKWTTGRNVVSALVLLVWLACANWAAGKPLDAKAAEEARTLETLAKKPPAERRLSAEELERFLHFTQTDNSGLKLVSVLALAYATDAVSGARLREIEAADDELLSGAATYAVISRELVGKERDEQLNLLSLRLKVSNNPYSRLFLANRIAVDFGDSGVSVIVETLKLEGHDIVKCDMLYYVVAAPVLPDNAEDILALNWNPAVSVPEDLAFVMRSLTPGRSNNPERNLTTTLLAELRAKQAQSRPGGGQGP